MSEAMVMMNMNERQRSLYLAEMAGRRKDAAIGVMLAFFLGSFGAHQFYLGRNGLAIFYLVFFWTGIPGIIAIVECFFMPGRVREYNDTLAVTVAAQVIGMTAGAAPAASHSTNVCQSCGTALAGGLNFCGSCGARAATI